MANYWEERERQKQAQLDKLIAPEVDKVYKAISETVKKLEDEIYRIYAKYAIDNEMSYADALKYLTDDERAEFQKDVKYYVEKYKDSAYVKAHKTELHSLSVRARVKRIEQFKTLIIQHSKQLYDALEDMPELLKDVYGEGYYRAVYESLGGLSPEEIQSRVDIVEAVDPKTVRELLRTPWSGYNYSDKIWNISNDFTNKLQEKLVQGLIQGKHPREIAREFRRLGFGKQEKNKDGTVRKGGINYRAESLIQTEATYIIEQGQKQAYIDTGVGEYIFMTAKDHRVCDICRKINRNKYKVDEARPQVNYPPMHVRCRCTTRAVTKYDGEDESQYDMPYDEWYSTYIAKKS